VTDVSHESEPNNHRMAVTYVLVVVVEAAVIAALWSLSRSFS
jgi:hypothetical protein